MILTDYFLKKELQRLVLKASGRPHRYRCLNDVKTILFICDAKDWDTGRHCVEKLKSMNKTVNTAIYAPTAKDVPTWYSNYLLLRADKDVNIWGFPDKTIQKQFNCLPADLILDLSGEPSPAMYYLVLQHPSTFKAGIKRSENSRYDFSIIPPADKNDFQYHFDQLLSYLQSVTSKK
ncbi:MAG: hypothetical protein LBC47_04500 [Tannerella sp.]|jgi:hypothetical protein|nr:hypothetical protein [Tannerella sp.]